MRNISILLRLSKRKTSESSFLEWRQGNARGLRDQCSLCVNNGDKLTSHTFQKFLTILCTFQEEMSKLCSVWFFFFLSKTFNYYSMFFNTTKKITLWFFFSISKQWNFFLVFTSNGIYFKSRLIFECFYNIS